jgi:hypothetical protein
MSIKRMLGRVALDRARGERVSVIRALIAAVVVGFAAAVLTYRLLRR